MSSGPVQDGQPAAWPWIALTLAATLVAMRGVLSTSEVFFVRDLATYFWPHHLWLRATVAAGNLPLWNPGTGLGYAALADPALQLFSLPTLPIRLLLPEVVGFNLWIALPIPTAALGFFQFARRHVSPPAAAVSAIVYAVSGPVLSLVCCGNPAFTAALAPWVLAAIDRLAGAVSASLVGWLAVLFAGGVVAGEPVTLASTAAVAVGYAAFGTPIPAAGWRARGRLLAATCGAGVLGLLLASAQVFPLVDASRRSIRGAGLLADQWALPPLALIETVANRLFGDPLGRPQDFGPWLHPLSGGREPYIASLYLGVGALLLGWIGILAGRPRRLAWFWLAALVGLLVMALGWHTPAYASLRSLLPVLQTFRHPVKHTAIATLALAVLVALGSDALRGLAQRSAGLKLGALAAGGVLAGLALCGTWTLLVAPATLHGAAAALAVSSGLADPAVGATFLLARLEAAAPPLLTLALAGTACLAVCVSRRPEARIARAALLSMTVLDPLAANATLNPTMDAASLGAPEWVAATRPHANERVFIAQDLVPSAGLADEDNPPPPLLRRDVRLVRTLAEYEAKLRRYPAAWGVREALSIEVTGLAPVEYLDLLFAYEGANRESRTRYLQRAGTRYYLLPHPPAPDARALLRLTGLPALTLYEGPAPNPRAWVVSQTRLEPDVSRQVARLFDAGFDPLKEVLLERTTPAAGQPGLPAPASAVITVDQPQQVCVRCAVPADGGHLVLSDSYDPNWHVRVDGQPAPLLRADGLFRAVALAVGTHDVCFSYQSRPLRWGIAVSCLTALGLLAAAGWQRRR